MLATLPGFFPRCFRILYTRGSGLSGHQCKEVAVQEDLVQIYLKVQLPDDVYHPLRFPKGQFLVCISQLRKIFLDVKVLSASILILLQGLSLKAALSTSTDEVGRFDDLLNPVLSQSHGEHLATKIVGTDLLVLPDRLDGPHLLPPHVVLDPGPDSVRIAGMVYEGNLMVETGLLAVAGQLYAVTEGNSADFRHLIISSETRKMNPWIY